MSGIQTRVFDEFSFPLNSDNPGTLLPHTTDEGRVGEVLQDNLLVGREPRLSVRPV